MTIAELRSARIAAEIPATLLALKAGVNRSRLSGLERGHLQATNDEMQRLHTALDQLIHARSVVQQAAVSVGWPITGVG